MSDTDPYMAPDYPSVQEARFEVSEKDTANPVAEIKKAAEASQTDEITVPEGSAAKVLEWVGDDRTRAQAALAAEKRGDKRTTLTKKLKDILEKSE